MAFAPMEDLPSCVPEGNDHALSRGCHALAVLRPSNGLDGIICHGKCADFFAVNLNRIESTGMHDPVSAIVFGQPVRVDYTVVNGKFIVKEGQLVTVDERKLIERHNQAAKRLLLS